MLGDFALINVLWWHWTHFGICSSGWPKLLL